MLSNLLKSVLCSAVALGATSALAQGQEAMKASELIGMRVQDRDSGAAGRIDDLVVDIANNRVHYAVLDMAERRLAMPLERLSFPAGASHAAMPTPHAGPVAPRAGMALVRASTLLGWEVETRPGRDIGRITELVVEPGSAQVPFAVLRLYEAPQGELHAAPLDAFAMLLGRENLVVDADRAAMLAAPSFSMAELDAGLADREFLKKHSRAADQLTPPSPAVGAAARPERRSALFEKLDRDNDGFLSEREMDRPLAESRSWLALDTDQDGRISSGEFAAMQGE